MDPINIDLLIDINQATLSFIARGKMTPSRDRIIQLSIGLRSDKRNLVNKRLRTLVNQAKNARAFTIAREVIPRL